MATIKKRKNKNGTVSYEAMVRPKDGLPPSYKRFPTRQEAKDWALQQEAQRRQGLYFPEQVRKKHTVTDLIDRYIEMIIPSKQKNARDPFGICVGGKRKLAIARSTLSRLISLLSIGKSSSLV